MNVRRIRHGISKLCGWMGIHIDRIPSAVALQDQIKNYSAQIGRYEIRNYTNFLMWNTDHKRYEKFLNTFIPERKVNISRASFVKEGDSEEALRSHRKVLIDGKWYFEKVFFSLYKNLQCTLWFQDMVYKHVKTGIKVPLIQKHFSGQWVSVAYFEFLNLRMYDNLAETQQQLIKVFEMLTRLDEILKQIPGVIAAGKRDFHKTTVYAGNLADAEISFQKHGYSINRIAEDIVQTPLRFCHGDLHSSNICRNNVVLDWDMAGFYPVGYEHAVMYRNLLHFREVQNLNAFEWLKDWFGNECADDTDGLLSRNFLFFLLVFTSFYDKGAPWWPTVRENLWAEAEKRDHLLYLKSKS